MKPSVDDDPDSRGAAHRLLGSVACLPGTGHSIFCDDVTEFADELIAAYKHISDELKTARRAHADALVVIAMFTQVGSGYCIVCDDPIAECDSRNSPSDDPCAEQCAGAQIRSICGQSVAHAPRCLCGRIRAEHHGCSWFIPMAIADQKEASK